nr:hypothetical protein [Rubrivivax sp.]
LLPCAEAAGSHAGEPSLQRVAVSGAAHALRITLPGRPYTDTWFHARGAVVQDAVVEGVGFSGRWLHLRHGNDGHLLHATSHTGARVRAGTGVPVTLTDRSSAAADTPVSGPSKAEARR